MNTNWMILGLTLLVAIVSCEISNDEQGSNLRLDLTSFLREATNAVKQDKVKRMLLQSYRHRQQIEAASAKADAAFKAALKEKDHEAAKEAKAVALEMREAAAEAKKMIRALLKMERKTARRQRAEAATKKYKPEAATSSVVRESTFAASSEEDPTDPEAATSSVVRESISAASSEEDPTDPEAATSSVVRESISGDIFEDDYDKTRQDDNDSSDDDSIDPKPDSSGEDPVDPQAEAEGADVNLPSGTVSPGSGSKPTEEVLKEEGPIQSEITDPDEAGSGIKKLVKKTHENFEKKPHGEVIISKGMTKDQIKINGEVARKMVKESEDKKPNGEEIVDKQANLEIDREPNAALNQEGHASGADPISVLASFFTMMALTFVLVF